MVKQVHYNKLSDDKQKDLFSLLKEANKDQFLKNYFILNDFDEYKTSITSIISDEDNLVGFYKPRKVSTGHYKGYYRSEPIYIGQGYRRKGYAKEVLSEYFKNKKGMCWIADKNINSQKLYRSLGFKKSNFRSIDPEDNEWGTSWFKE